MTKVDLRYKLLHKVDDEKLLDVFARIHGVYGMSRVMLTPSMDEVLVEFDASRLNVHEVETILRGYGLPIVPSSESAG